MSNLEILKRDVHAKTLAFRTIDRIVQSRTFEQAFNIERDHTDLEEAILHGNVEWIEDWIENTIKLEIGELSLRELRKKAAQYSVLRYTAMTKDELIVALTQAIHHARKAQETARRMSSQEEGCSASNTLGAGRTIFTPTGR